MELPEIGKYIRFKKEHQQFNHGMAIIPTGTIAKIVKVDYIKSNEMYEDRTCLLTIAFRNNMGYIHYSGFNYSIAQHTVEIIPDTEAAKILYEEK